MCVIEGYALGFRGSDPTIKIGWKAFQVTLNPGEGVCLPDYWLSIVSNPRIKILGVCETLNQMLLATTTTWYFVDALLKLI